MAVRRRGAAAACLAAGAVGSVLTLTSGLLSVNSPWLCHADSRGAYPDNPFCDVLPAWLQGPVAHPVAFTLLPLVIYPCVPMAEALFAPSCLLLANTAAVCGVLGGLGRLAGLVFTRCVLTHTGFTVCLSGAGVEMVAYSCLFSVEALARFREERIPSG